MVTAKPAKAKKAAPNPPALTPKERTLKPHEVVLSPTIQNAVGVYASSMFASEADLVETIDDLREQVRQVQASAAARWVAAYCGFCCK